MPRGAKPGGITIGFVGTGVKAVDPATDLIEQYINDTVPDPDDPARFIFPLTSEEFSDSMADLTRMAKKSRIDYEVISLTGDRNRRLFTEVAQTAVKQYYVTDVWTQMEMILAEAPQAAVFVLWDDQREQELADICAKFMDAGIPVLDLTNNLIPLSKDEEEGEVIDAESHEVEEDEGPEPEAEEEAEASEKTAPEPYDDLGYTRVQLEKMGHSEVKDIAVGMGLAPRKARENMIIAILEKQGTPDTAPAAPVRLQTVVATTEAQEPSWDGLSKVLDAFGERFFVGLDEWLTKFSQAAEGYAFNTAPEEPMAVEKPEEEQPRRRLIRH
jgi:hypothetical protein